MFKHAHFIPELWEETLYRFRPSFTQAIIHSLLVPCFTITSI